MLEKLSNLLKQTKLADYVNDRSSTIVRSLKITRAA